MLSTCFCCAAASLISENEDFCSTCLEGYNAGQSSSSPFQLHNMWSPPTRAFPRMGLSRMSCHIDMLVLAVNHAMSSLQRTQRYGPPAGTISTWRASTSGWSASRPARSATPRWALRRSAEKGVQVAACPGSTHDLHGPSSGWRARCSLYADEGEHQKRPNTITAYRHMGCGSVVTSVYLCRRFTLCGLQIFAQCKSFTQVRVLLYSQNIHLDLPCSAHTCCICLIQSMGCCKMMCITAAVIARVGTM